MRVFIKINQQAQGSKVITSNKDTRADTNHKETRTSRHKVQGMQVTTSNKHTNHKARGDTNQQARGSRHAGNQ